MPRPVVPLLASRGFTGAVLVLVVNDHFLKQSVPGWITGKLSDVAGIVVVAVIVRYVVRNDVAAVVITALGFVTLKMVEGANEVAAPFLGGVTRQDPLDVLAVVALAPVYAWFRFRGGRPAIRALPISVLQVPAIVIAVMATTATSCYEPAKVDRLVIDDGVVWAGISDVSYDTNGEDQEQVRWARSDNGGRTWTGAEAPDGGVPAATTQACATTVCWRTVAEERVEVDGGSGWEPAFAFTHEQWRQQELAAQSSCDYPREDTFGSVAVLDGEAPIVLVTMGTQGIVRYDEGTWERIGVLDLVPTPMPGPSWLARIPLWTVLALSATAVLLAAGAFQRVWFRPRRRWFQAAMLAIMGGVSILMATGMALFFSSRNYPIWSAVSVGLALGVFVASVVSVARPLRPLPPPRAGSVPR